MQKMIEGVMWVILLFACDVLTAGEEGPVVDGGGWIGKKILWVDSYHEGYEWSDGIERGIRGVLEGKGVELRIFRMDTKRKSSEEAKKVAGMAAKAEVNVFQPDLVIASDDNAQSHFVVPFLKNTSLPVVFCGVNWDASIYGYPCENITGMVEVDLVEETVRVVRPYMKGDRVGYLSGTDETEKKIVEAYNRRFFGGTMKVALVTTFAEFQEKFLEFQKEVDLIFLRNNASIQGWDAELAKAFLLEHTVIPTATSNEWMAPFVAVCMARLGEEQGEWAAQAALQILGGAKPSEIPIAENRKAKLIVNLKMAKAAGVIFPASVLKTATIIGKD